MELNNGLAVPAIGLGTWKMTAEEAESAILSAIEIGYRHIDGAWIYQNEVGVGKGIAAGIERASIDRNEVWVTSKLWNDRHPPRTCATSIGRITA